MPGFFRHSVLRTVDWHYNIPWQQLYTVAPIARNVLT